MKKIYDLKFLVALFLVLGTQTSLAYETPESIVNALRGTFSQGNLWDDVGTVGTLDLKGRPAVQSYFRKTFLHGFYYSEMKELQLFLLPQEVFRGAAPKGSPVLLVISTDRDGSMEPKLMQAKKLFDIANRKAKLNLSGWEHGRDFIQITAFVKDTKGLSILMNEMLNLINRIKVEGAKAVLGDVRG